MREVVLIASLAASASAVVGCSLFLDTSGFSGAELPSVPGDDDGDGGALAPDGASSDADADADTDTIPVIARDTFSRTSVDELGIAEIGGAWTTAGAPEAFAVSSGAARITLANGSTRTGTLDGVSADDVDAQLVMTTDKVTNGTAYLSLVARSVGSAEYRCRLVVDGGSAHATISRLDGNDSLTHVATSAPLFVVTAGEGMRIRCQARGTGPTELRMKLWRAALAEPTAWTLVASDPTPSHQAPGAVGFHFYMSGTTNGPIVVSLDDLLVRPASLLP